MLGNQSILTQVVESYTKENKDKSERRRIYN